MTTLVCVSMCLTYVCLVLLSKSCVCVCEREREKRYCSFTPPSSLGLDVFLMAQLDPSASCPYFTPATRTPPFYFSLSLFLSLSLSLVRVGARPMQEQRVHKDMTEKDVSVCV